MSYIVNRPATGPFSLTANGTFQQVPQSSTLYGGTATITDINTILGTKWDTEDGRELTLVLAGASNLAQGKAMQSAALIANHQNLVTVSFTAYSTTNGTPASVLVTLGGTAVTANQYQNGYAVVTSGTGLGQTLQIQGHLAQASTTGNVSIVLADATNIALDATSTISLVPQPGNGVIINPTARTNAPVGVTLYPITAANYGFVVSKGVTSALIDASAPAAGAPLSVSSATAGALGQTRYATNVVTDAVVGKGIVATTSAQYQPVYVDF